MNSRIIQSIFALALLVLLGSAAQAQDVKVTAQVPFDFNVVGSALPAGDYELDNLNLPRAVFRIRSEDCKKVALRVVHRTERFNDLEQGYLVFNRYRGNGGEEVYFLSQIWVQGQSAGYKFPKGRDEKAAALRAARRDMITIVVRNANRAAE